MRLNEVETKTRLLITLSDGKPDGYDNYRGKYGIEDTRRALIEARRAVLTLISPPLILKPRITCPICMAMPVTR